MMGGRRERHQERGENRGKYRTGKRRRQKIEREGGGGFQTEIEIETGQRGSVK